jgi:hypothetical protein
MLSDREIATHSEPPQLIVAIHPTLLVPRASGRTSKIG